MGKEGQPDLPYFPDRVCNARRCLRRARWVLQVIDYRVTRRDVKQLRGLLADPSVFTEVKK